MFDRRRQQYSWARVNLSVAVAPFVHAIFFVLESCAAIVVVLWQTAPALLIIGLIFSYHASSCLLLTAVVAVLTRYGQNSKLSKTCTSFLRVIASLSYASQWCCLLHVLGPSLAFLALLPRGLSPSSMITSTCRASTFCFDLIP